MSEPQFGWNDAALAAAPRVFEAGLFDGQVVMVSGAGSGIGKAIAFLYARLGAKLVICGRDRAKLDACEPWLRKLGSPDVLVQQTNIRQPRCRTSITCTGECRACISICLLKG